MPRVLIVDDETDVRTLLRTTLGEFGFESEEAGTGQEALARLQLGTYDLVILDLSMPGSDGFDVLEGLDLLSYRPRVAVLTARTSEEDRQRSYDLGAIDLTTKPFDPYDFITKLTGLLQLEDEELERRVHRDMKTSRLVGRLEEIMKRPDPFDD